MRYENQYEGVIPAKVVKMIRCLAQKMGLRKDDQQDAEQLAAMEVMNFNYDPQKCNGASEDTMLYALVLNTLKAFIRAKTRHDQRVEEYATLFPIDPETGEYLHPSDDDPFRDADIRLLVMQLPPCKQTICECLVKEIPQREMAQMLGVSRNRLLEMIEEIRQTFCDAGYSDWMEG